LWGISLHPTQLYEALANIGICLFLLYYAFPRAKRRELLPGTVFLGYIALYSTVRFIIEFYRGDERGWSCARLSVSQWIAIVCLLTSGVLMAYRGLTAREKPA
jgi:prolipoprotein diacylglyceryltransferase